MVNNVYNIDMVNMIPKRMLNNVCDVDKHTYGKINTRIVNMIPKFTADKRNEKVA